MPAPNKYLENSVINGVIFVREIENINKRRRGLFKCPMCENFFEAIISKVAEGHTRSCGCLQKAVVSQISKKHGLHSHALYATWNGIISRATNIKSDSYHRYGGRGIKVCKQWEDCSVFIDWALSNGWQKGLQVDRINNDGDYEPDNCRIVTPLINSNNSTACNKCVLDGKIVSDREASRLLGHHLNYISRVRAGTRSNRYKDRLQIL